MSAGRSGGWRWLALLCLVASSRWIPENQWPQMGSTLRSEAIACGIAAAVMFAVSALLRRSAPGLQSVLELVAVGAGLFAAPSFGSALSGPAGNPFNRTVAMCFVPTMVTVLSGIWSDTASSWSLWPGLAGLGGALLIFPLSRPSDVPGYVALLAPPLVVSAACVGCRKITRELATEWSAAWLFVGGALGLLMLEGARMAGSGVPAQMFSAGAVVTDVVLVALGAVVILCSSTFRYASQYFWIPLLTIVEYLSVMREGFTLRLGAGLVLLAVAAGAMVRGRDGDAPPSGLGLT